MVDSMPLPMPRRAALAIRVLLFACGSLCYALLGILSQLSKEEDGTYGYSLPSVVLTAEAVKLLLSCCFLTAERGSLVGACRGMVQCSPWLWLAYTIPSVLYALNNNLDMLNNLHMDPATEHVLVQGKILTTGLVWWLVFREPLGLRKWLSLLVLFSGAVLAGMPSEALFSGSRQMHIDSVGCVLVTVHCWVSACAGVYNEWLLKVLGKDDSIHISNIRLYSIGCVVNLTAHILSDHGAGQSLFAFKGYNRYVVALVVTYASMGLLLSQVMKWFDNIVKLFISGSSMYVSALFAWTIFGYAPTVNFCIGVGLVTIAMLIFNLDKIRGAMQSTEKKET
mmetsp:Transcript_69964/g.177567  ORF Transcript_69964/g.177567 Transcript_69964/m.177567 type:complete len:337 (+) Transcript_69964:120-1130(+)